MVISFPEKLQTERLLLCRMTDADYAELLAMHQDPRVMATLGGLIAVEDLQARHQRHLEHWRLHGFGWWVARTRTGGHFVGRGGLRSARVEGKDEIEVSYGLVPEYWGQRLAVELAQASVQVAYQVLKVTELVCFTLPTNLRSRRVMEKVGFQYDKVFEWSGLPHVLYRLSGLNSTEPQMNTAKHSSSSP